MPAFRLPKLLFSCLLPLTLASGAPHRVRAAEPGDAPPLCPVGVVNCPKRKTDFELCKRNDLLDFFTPGLPPAGDRSKATTDVTAQRQSTTDRTHQHLEGNVELQRLDALLKADFLDFDTETTDYTANGHVVYQDHADLMSADHAHGTGTPSTTFLDNVRYQMLDQRGNGVAATVNQTDPDHSKMHAGTYSTCDPDDRQWEIRSKDMDIDHAANEGHAHDVTVYYEGVPFFWFPYLSFPLDKQRESGFLMPGVGYSDRRGLVLGIPYYLNLAPNYDATLDPRVMTERGPMLGGQFRYLDSTSKLQLDFNYVPRDDQTDSEREFVRLLGSHTLSENWGFNIDINHVSDKNYLRDYGDSFSTSAVSLLSSSAYFTGRGTWWTASLGGDAWELTDPTLSDAFQPYRRLPHLTFQGEHPVLGLLNAGVNGEYTDFEKSDALTGQRIDLYPYLSLPVETSAYFIRPQLGVRYTGYDLNHLNLYANTQPFATPLTETSPSRTTPIFDLDAGLVFERNASLFGGDYTQTLEPRVYYLRVPYRNQDDLPVLDTQLPTFDFPSLFRTNTFVGADRQTNANNLTGAVTTRLINNDSGDQVLSASLGQIHYFGTQRVQLPGYPELDYSGSDYVGELDLRLNDRWDVRWDQQFNPNTHQTDLSAIGLERRFGAEGVLNVSYRFRRGFLEQVDTTALVPINDRWSVIARYYYSLMNRQLLEAFAGAEYDSCCVAVRTLVRHYVNIVGTSKADTALYFEIEFKGFGSSGTRTENYLRRAMLGYE